MFPAGGGVWSCIDYHTRKKSQPLHTADPVAAREELALLTLAADVLALLRGVLAQAVLTTSKKNSLRCPLRRSEKLPHATQRHTPDARSLTQQHSAHAVSGRCYCYASAHHRSRISVLRATAAGPVSCGGGMLPPRRDGHDEHAEPTGVAPADAIFGGAGRRV